MYESITYELILKRMLDKIPNTIDKREGSIIYNALAPAAAELQNMYIELDWILNQSFADTAQRTYLIKRSAERGIIVEPATKAILEGTFNIDIPIGSRFSLDNLNYIAKEKISTGKFKMECETLGLIGSQKLGQLIPIDYINGLTSATLTAVLTPGEDEETTEALRTRYLNSFIAKPYGGNRQDYITKTNAISGVGATKVTPTWNGGGTVKITILDSSFNKASQSLINTVKTTLDPVGTQGQGNGVAPIGHIVTVDAPTEITVNIALTIVFMAGYTWAMIQQNVLNALGAYLLEIRKDWSNQTTHYVRLSQIETRVLAITGVLDITSTTINGSASNLVLNNFEIPILGVVTG